MYTRGYMHRITKPLKIKKKKFMYFSQNIKRAIKVFIKKIMVDKIIK